MDRWNVGTVHRSIFPSFRLGRRHRQDPQRRRRRAHRAIELCEHNVHGIEGPRRELRHQRFHDIRRVGRRGPVADVDPLRRHGAARELEEPDPLLAQEMEVHLCTLVFQLLHASPCFADQVGVERAAQAPVRRDEDDRGALHAVRRLAQQGEPLRERRRVEIADDLRERLRVGSRADDAILGALQLRRGDELHRLRDLARVLDGADAPLQLTGLRHYRLPSALYSSMAFFSRPLRSSESALRVLISSTRPSCCAAMNSSRPFSHALIAGTSTSSMRPLVTAKMTITCWSTRIGWYCGCLSTSTTRAPRASCRWVAGSSSEPNCANASSSRYCARSKRRRPATCFIALICALPPTRLTEMPAFTAGRTFE